MEILGDINFLSNIGVICDKIGYHGNINMNYMMLLFSNDIY